MVKNILVTVMSLQLLVSSTYAWEASAVFALDEISSTGGSSTGAGLLEIGALSVSATAVAATVATGLVYASEFVVKFIKESFKNGNRKLLLVELIEQHRLELIQYVNTRQVPPFRTQDYLLRVREEYPEETKELTDLELSQNLINAVKVLEKAAELTKEEISRNKLSLDPKTIKDGR